MRTIVASRARWCSPVVDPSALGAVSIVAARRRRTRMMQGARRLFSAWLEGQMLERGLPGVAVGVVADQELVWATGFGFADLRGQRCR